MLIPIGLATLVISSFLFLRSNYISYVIGGYVSGSVNRNYELNIAGGSFYINPFPLYIGAKDLILTDNDGFRVGSMKRAKAYIDLSSAISGTAEVNRVVLESPDIKYIPRIPGSHLPDRKGAEESLEAAWTGVLIIKNGAFSYNPDNNRAPLSISGIDAELSFGEALWALFSIGKLEYDIPGKQWPVVSPSLHGRVKYGNDLLEVDALSAYIGESVFRAGGVVSKPGKPGMRGDLDITISLDVGSIRDSFGLERNPEGEIRSEGTLSIGEKLEDSLLDMEIEGDFYLEALLDALRHSQREHYSGHIECRGSLKGPLTALNGSADAVISDSRIQGIDLDRATALVIYEDDSLSITHGKADLYKGKADVEVYFGLISDRPFGLSVMFSDVVSQPLLDRINIGHIGLPEGRLTGEFLSDGMHFSPRGWIRFQGDERDDTPLGRMSYFAGRFHTENDILILEDFDLRSQKTQVSFDGRVSLNGQYIAFDGYSISTDYSDVLYPLDYGFSSGGRLDISVKGTKNDPRVSIDASLWGSSFRGYNLGQAALSADYQKDLLTIKQLRIKAGDSYHEASGSVRFPESMHLFDVQAPYFDLQAMAGNANLGGLISVFIDGIDISGLADTNASLKGPLDALALDGQVDVRDMTAYGRAIDSGTLEFFLKGDKLGLHRSRFTRKESELTARGHWYFGGEYEVDAKARNAWLTYFLPDMERADFKVNMEVSGQGSISQPSLELKAELLDGHFMNVPVHEGTLRASLERDNAKGFLDLMNGKLSAKGRAKLKDDIPWEIDLSMGYDRYDHVLRAFSKGLPRDLIMAMGGNVSFTGDRNHLNARVRLKKANATLFGQGFANIGPFEFDIADRSIRIRNIKMRGAHAAFDLWGGFEIGRSIDIGLSANSSLLPYARFMSTVSSMRGNTSLSVNINGTFDKPLLEGKMEISDASVTIRGMPQKITSINSRIVLGNGRIVIDNATAKAGGGDINLSGTCSLDGMRIYDISLEGMIKDMSARLSPHISSSLDGFLLLTGDSKSQNINGEVAVKKASYTQKVDWREILLRKGSGELSDGSAWRDNVKLNVRLYGYENISVDNNLAIAPVRGDLYVRGTLAAPVLFGRVETVGGKAFYRSSKLDIVSATADYLDMPVSMPVIGFSAETEIKGYEIWVNMQGRADRLDLDLASDPPLEYNEILTLLTLGEIRSGSETIQDLGAEEAASFAKSSTGITEIMEERASIYTGLDRIQVDPYVIGSSGSVTQRLTVTEKLLEDKLYLTYAATLEDETEVKLEYILGDNVSVLGGQDYTGSVGGDLKFRFRFE